MSIWRWGPLGVSALIALVVGWLAWMVWLPQNLADGTIRAIVLFAAWQVVLWSNIRFEGKRWTLISVICWWALYVAVMLPVLLGFLGRLGVKLAEGGFS